MTRHGRPVVREVAMGERLAGLGTDRGASSLSNRFASAVSPFSPSLPPLPPLPRRLHMTSPGARDVRVSIPCTRRDHVNSTQGGGASGEHRTGGGYPED